MDTWKGTVGPSECCEGLKTATILATKCGATIRLCLERNDWSCHIIHEGSGEAETLALSDFTREGLAILFTESQKTKHILWL